MNNTDITIKTDFKATIPALDGTTTLTVSFSDSVGDPDGVPVAPSEAVLLEIGSKKGGLFSYAFLGPGQLDQLIELLTRAQRLFNSPQ